MVFFFQHGGVYSPHLEKECTHLIALEPTGAKYVHAIDWGIKVCVYVRVFVFACGVCACVVFVGVLFVCVCGVSLLMGLCCFAGRFEGLVLGDDRQTRYFSHNLRS